MTNKKIGSDHCVVQILLGVLIILVVFQIISVEEFLYSARL